MQQYEQLRMQATSGNALVGIDEAVLEDVAHLYEKARANKPPGPPRWDRPGIRLGRQLDLQIAAAPAG